MCSSAILENVTMSSVSESGVKKLNDLAIMDFRPDLALVVRSPVRATINCALSLR